MLHGEFKPGEFVCLGMAFVRLTDEVGTIRVENCRASWGPAIDKAQRLVIRARFETVDRACRMTPVYFSPQRASPEIREMWPEDDPRKE